MKELESDQLCRGHLEVRGHAAVSVAGSSTLLKWKAVQMLEMIDQAEIPEQPFQVQAEALASEAPYSGILYVYGFLPDKDPSLSRWKERAICSSQSLPISERRFGEGRTRRQGHKTFGPWHHAIFYGGVMNYSFNFPLSCSCPYFRIHRQLPMQRC